MAPVLPDWSPTAGIVHAVFPTCHGRFPAVQTLLAFLTHECAAQRNRANKTFAK
ncbi:LysR family transcriptional regulator [Novacetimonas hansenii]|nr:LysR family transcriptional regulator [Novacetimonas hansenii]